MWVLWHPTVRKIVTDKGENKVLDEYEKSVKSKELAWHHPKIREKDMISVMVYRFFLVETQTTTPQLRL